MKLRRPTGLLILATALLGQFGAAQEITVAAAADLQSAMQDIAGRFQKESGKTVRVIYGSSGNFFQQVQNGAPFDMFFSANLDYPKKLEAAGLTRPDSYYQYARGKIVVWISKDSKIDLSAGLKALLDPRVKKIAIANPQHAPYGQAAVSAMEKEGIYERRKTSLCSGRIFRRQHHSLSPDRLILA
jgi:molybdate transport system substrate-binding protein